MQQENKKSCFHKPKIFIFYQYIWDDFKNESIWTPGLQVNVNDSKTDGLHFSACSASLFWFVLALCWLRSESPVYTAHPLNLACQSWFYPAITDIWTDTYLLNPFTQVFLCFVILENLIKLLEAPCCILFIGTGVWGSGLWVGVGDVGFGCWILKSGVRNGRGSPCALPKQSTTHYLLLLSLMLTSI